MKYIGVPRCPYCNKRVGFIRTWRLKREGEYKCPRCSGISNIYLSPLIYVLAVLAVFASGMLYFFHKFILSDMELTTAIEVAVPFALFFLLSLFMVYLEKPQLKKVAKKPGQGAPRQMSGARPSGMARPSGTSQRTSPQGIQRNTAPAQRPINRDSRRDSGRDMNQTQMFREDFDYTVPFNRSDVSEAPTGLPYGANDAHGGTRVDVPRVRDMDRGPQKIGPQVKSKPLGASSGVPTGNPTEAPTGSSKKKQANTSSAASGGGQRPAKKPLASGQKAAKNAQADAFADSPVLKRRGVQMPDGSQVDALSPVVSDVKYTDGVDRSPKPAPAPPMETDDFFAKYDDPEYIRKRMEEISRKK